MKSLCKIFIEHSYLIFLLLELIVLISRTRNKTNYLMEYKIKKNLIEFFVF